MDTASSLLSSPPPLHPVLLQIQNLNTIFGQPVAAPVIPTPAGQAATDQLGDEFGRIAEEGLQESISVEVFSSYKHNEILPGCQPHPGDIVEAGPLASLTLPDATYPLADSLPKEMITERKLSSLQLEGILYACQRHQMILPSGQRAGFFIGDAAGVGKGRQIAGIIFDNFARGRTRHIWFTISSDLIVDARRDLSDIGCFLRVIDGCQELDRETRVLGLPADFREGVVFSTYATLVSSIQKGGSLSNARHTRLQQLVNWCGGEHFDGCLIFDECHKAKNFVPGKEQASTKVAVAVTTIQRMLPKARVLYCSATGVSDVKNMAFMERLGLWGVGAPFKTFEHFLDSMHRKGLGMAEMLAMEMKMSGMYVSRGLSYKQAEVLILMDFAKYFDLLQNQFLTVESELTPEQTKMYNTAAHVWNELRKALESAVVRTDTSNRSTWSQFWSSHQRFFKQLCMGMKVPFIIKETKEALATGHCVVIGLQTTGEASLESELMKSKGSVTGFVSLCREIIVRFIEQFFPTVIQNQKDGDPCEDQWSVTAKKMLLDFCHKISLPDSPLDEIIDKLGGPQNVSEMTGRRGRIVRNSPNDTPHYEHRTPDSDAYGAIESLNVQERNYFMEGQKEVAIISDAASTGISLHSDLRVANQKRRVHLTVELPWSADKAVQQLGRSHRSNQSSGPLYKLLTTNLGGERRFAASVARRLQSLGALTKGDRRAATGADLTEFNFDTPYGRNALRMMYHNISHIATSPRVTPMLERKHWLSLMSWQHTAITTCEKTKKTLVPGILLKNLTQDKYDFNQFNSIMQECLVLMGLVEIDTLRSGPQIREKDAGDVSKFLNRILGLGVEKQNLIFSYFTECMKMTVDNAKKEGRYNEGMLDITAGSIEMVGKPKEVFKEVSKGHATTRLVHLNVDRGMSWDMAITRCENHSGPQDGFYISRREIWGKKLVILVTQKESSTHLCRIARPNTGLAVLEEEKSDLLKRYVPVTPEKAEKHWKEYYEMTKENCIHGPTCKNKPFCKVGSRCYGIHLLCGSIVTLMSVLEATLNKYALKLNLTKSESAIRVVRVRLNNNERVVGVRYPSVLIAEVEKALKEKMLIESIQQAQTEQIEAQAKQTISSVPEVNGQNDVPLDADALVKSFKRSVIEEVASVNPKCKARAMRPPVTIKNFFKPSVHDKSSNSVSSEDSESPVRNSQETQMKELNYEDFISQTAEVKNEDTYKVEGNLRSDNTPKPCTETADTSDCTEVKNKYDSEDCKSVFTSAIGTEVVTTSSVGQKKDLLSKNSKSSHSRKRTINSASSQPAKKQKQLSLMSSFAKATTKKEDLEHQVLSCPICGQLFEKGISNADVNSHIDNCIID